MKTRLLCILTCMLLLSIGRANAQSPLPGTPLNGGSFGTLDLTDGATVLPGLVTPGDLVLNEIPTAPSDVRTNWSNVIRFTNIDTPVGRVGIAYHISDGEAGVSNIGIGDVTGAPVLPDALQNNSVFRQEIQVGTGTEADITKYATQSLPGGPVTTYNVHSDAALTSEPVETVPVSPGAPTIAVGGIGHWIIFIPDTDATEAGAIGLPFPFVLGAGTLLEPGGAVSDNLVWGLGGFAWASDPFAVGGFPGGVGIETFFADVEGLDATYISIEPEADVPEPSAFVSLGLGTLLLGFVGRRRKKAV